LKRPFAQTILIRITKAGFDVKIKGILSILFAKKSRAQRHPQFVNRQSSIIIRHSLKFHTSGAAGLKSGQLNRKINYAILA
jgi:hypothetical protein